jgi:16S rRNA (guanine527-N7)-methyltransferase
VTAREALRSGLETLRLGAESVGVRLSTEQCAKLVAYADLIRQWSDAMNLVSRADLDRLESRHLIDSLAFAPHVRGPRIADLGTGAGLPGIPIAIARPEVAVTLLDRSEKRLRFVRHVCVSLALPNVDVLAAEAERFRPGTGFDTVVARALAEPDDTWRLARPLLAAHGRLVWATATAVAVPDIGRARATTHQVTLPGVERRHQLIVVDVGDAT